MISLSYLFENKNKTYDSVSWHTDKIGNKIQINHIKMLMNWLNKNNLLSSEGKELLKTKIGEDFSITSDMLTDEGNKLLDTCYSEWLKSISYNTKPSTLFWDKKLKDIRSNK